MEDQPLKKKKKVTSPPLPTRSGTTNGPVSQKGASEVTVQNAECPGLFRAKKKQKKKQLVRHQREGLAYLKIFAKAESKVLGCVCSARVFVSANSGHAWWAVVTNPEGEKATWGLGFTESAIATANSFAKVPGSAACGWRWGWGRVRRPRGPGSTTTPPKPPQGAPTPQLLASTPEYLEFLFPQAPSLLEIFAKVEASLEPPFLGGRGRDQGWGCPLGWRLGGGWRPQAGSGRGFIFELGEGGPVSLHPSPPETPGWRPGSCALLDNGFGTGWGVGRSFVLRTPLPTEATGLGQG